MSSPSANLLEHVVAGSIGSLSKLQESLNLTIDQITDWIGSARTRAQLDSLQALFNTQAQLMICQHRLLAVARLAELITTATSPETIRRACNDLLKTELIQLSSESRAGKRSDPPNPMQPPDEPTQAMIRQALSEMGRTRHPGHESDSEHESAANRRPDHDAQDAEAQYLFTQKGTEIAAAPAALFSQKGKQIAPAIAADETASSDRRAASEPPSIAAVDRRHASRQAWHSHQAHGRDPPGRL